MDIIRYEIFIFESVINLPLIKCEQIPIDCLVVGAFTMELEGCC